MRWEQIFFEDKLHSVCQRLQQAKRADPRGSPAILNMADNLALQPDRVRDGREQDAECDYDLNDGNENEYA